MRAQDVEQVAVIGAGTMGAVIAGEMARVGCRVRLMDLDDARIAKGLERLREAQEALIGAGLLKPRDAAGALKRIEGVTDVASACRDADLLVEAASEKLDLKRTLFKQFDRLCPKHAVLATNTSGLSITRIASATQRPAKVVGMHFWNPPHLIPLVEVIKGKRTSDVTARLMLDMVRRIGKRPVLVRRDVPGFIGNRLQFAVMREALHLVETGVASPEDVDTAMSAGPGLRWGVIGPLQTADLGGLDVFHAISSYLFADLADRKTASPDLAKRVKQGKLGAKTGEGFYRYTGTELKKIVARRDTLLLEFLKAQKSVGEGLTRRAEG